jgi:hypothetical protein
VHPLSALSTLFFHPCVSLSAFCYQEGLRVEKATLARRLRLPKTISVIGAALQLTHDLETLPFSQVGDADLPPAMGALASRARLEEALAELSAPAESGSRLDADGDGAWHSADDMSDAV